MKRSTFNQILRQMEQCRHLEMGAETKREARSLRADYRRMHKAILPYCRPTNPKPFDPE